MPLMWYANPSASIRTPNQPYMKKHTLKSIVMAACAGLFLTAGINTYGDTSVVVYATPIASNGNQGSCPGPYTSYVNFTKSVSQGWGWKPSTNTTIHIAANGGDRPDVKVEFVGKRLDSGCSPESVLVPDPAYSTAYRFTIYFTNGVPSTNYPITLTGFDP